MVISQFAAKKGLPGMTVASLQEQFAALTLAIQRGGTSEVLNPKGDTAIEGSDLLTLQCEYRHYLRLRAHTGETVPPISLVHA